MHFGFPVGKRFFFFFFARFTEIFQFNTHFNILLPFPADAAGANVCGVVCTFGSEVKHGF